MSVAPDDKWPPYLVYPREDVMALGVVSLNYGLLERMFQHLFEAVGDFNEHQIAAFFQRINNNVRLTVFNELIDKTNISSELKDDAEYFCSAYKICAENRHALMHSRGAGIFRSQSRGTGGMMLKRATRSGKPIVCAVTLPDLRTVADDIHAFTSFGGDVITNVRSYKTCLREGRIHEFSRLQLRGRPPPPTDMHWSSESDLLDTPHQP